MNILPLDYHNQYIYQASYDTITSFPALYYASYDAMKGVMWKPSVQNVFLDLPIILGRLTKELKDKNFKSPGFNHFIINERGKQRDIHSIHIIERIVQKALCDYALKPAVIPRLIYTNCASLEGKGTSFAINRLRKDLVNAYNKYSSNCYILIMDYSKYYDSIVHEILLNNFYNWIDDKDVFLLFKYFVDMFQCMTTNNKTEYNDGNKNIGKLNETKVGIYSDIDLDLLEANFIDSDEQIIEKYDLHKGIGLGSEISQIAAISYTNKIDHAIKELYKMDAYTKYMDDSYIICNDLNKLKECYNYIVEESANIGLHLNPKHTRIYKITDTYYFLKKKIYIKCDTGKIIMQLNSDAITRHRHLIRSHSNLVNNGLLTFESAYMSFIGWRESNAIFDSRNALKELTNDFVHTFWYYIHLPEYEQYKERLYNI